jgi:hypothetical protein
LKLKAAAKTAKTPAPKKTEKPVKKQAGCDPKPIKESKKSKSK